MLKFFKIQGKVGTETDCILSERKGLLLDCSVGAKKTRSEDQSRLR